MTKEALRLSLASGKTMDELFQYTDGQLCLIYKANGFTVGQEIIYIPDIFLNSIPRDRPPKDCEELEDVLSECFTGDDFVDECNGDIGLARRLFNYCTWQHPSSALPEIVPDEYDSDDTEGPKERVKITIFQAPYASLLEHGLYQQMNDPAHSYSGTIPAEYYLAVFCGEIEHAGSLPEDQASRDRLILEQAFFTFNNACPKGYCGRSLSVGDVVQIEDRYYLCAVSGFTSITFTQGAQSPSIEKPPVIELVLPSGINLHARAYPESEYPCINIDMIDAAGKSVQLCFVEHNPEKEPGQELCIGVYCASDDEPIYYGPYNSKNEIIN